MREWTGETMLIKYGGSALGGPFEQVILDMISLWHAGMRIAVVHGGGKEISGLLTRLNLESKFVNGYRITDPETMKVVEMVLGGSINKRIVAEFQKNKVPAVGITGVDAGLLHVRQKDPALGLVGDVVQVHVQLLETLLDAGMIPVIAPIGVDSAGIRYNVNADSAAGAIAGALKADKMVMLTDVPGILKQTPAGKQVLNRVTPEEIHTLIREGQITGGMIPKVEACLQALAAGAKQVHILNGEEPHSLLWEMFTEKEVGTLVMGGSKV